MEMTIKYSRQDFDNEVESFATDIRKKTHKPVSTVGWRLGISHEHTWLEVSVLNHDGVVLTRNVAI